MSLAAVKASRLWVYGTRKSFKPVIISIGVSQFFTRRWGELAYERFAVLSSLQYEPP